MTDQKTVTILCAACSRQLCVALRWINDDDEVCHEDGREMLPPSTIGRASYEPIADLEWHAMNDTDLLVQRSSLRNVLETGTRSGCCGPDGGDGPNLSCNCGAIIGTEVSDCWMPHFVTLLQSAIEIIESSKQSGAIP
ncbi:MAG: hypothetical protein ACNA8P_01970 [Phycisphaerales bacterium]